MAIYPNCLSGIPKSGEFYDSDLIKVKESLKNKTVVWYRSFDSYTVVRQRKSGYLVWEDIARSDALLVYTHSLKLRDGEDGVLSRRRVGPINFPQRLQILSLVQFMWDAAGQELDCFSDTLPTLSQVVRIESIVHDMIANKAEDCKELHSALLSELAYTCVHIPDLHDLKSLLAFLDRIQILKDRIPLAQG